jgi:hypothetical protein
LHAGERQAHDQHQRQQHQRQQHLHSHQQRHRNRLHTRWKYGEGQRRVRRKTQKRKDSVGQSCQRVFCPRPCRRRKSCNAKSCS